MTMQGESPVESAKGLEVQVGTPTGVSKSSKKGFFYKSSYLRFEFFITMQN